MHPFRPRISHRDCPALGKEDAEAEAVRFWNSGQVGYSTGTYVEFPIFKTIQTEFWEAAPAYVDFVPENVIGPEGPITKFA